MSAWKSSMVKMEALLTGTSQAIQPGKLLLVAYSWHLFPHILATISGMDLITQADLVFSLSTTVTVGLEESPVMKKANSIYWSLPLARVRYALGSKRKLDQFLAFSGYRRWLCAGGGSQEEFEQVHQAFYRYRQNPGYDDLENLISLEQEMFPDEIERKAVVEDYLSRKARYEYHGEEVLKRDLRLDDFGRQCEPSDDHLCHAKIPHYILFYGDEDSTGFFVLDDSPNNLTKDWMARCDMRHFTALVEAQGISASAFACELYETLQTPQLSGVGSAVTSGHSHITLKAVFTMNETL
ncbi:uncharacterized protein BP01DRAFT_384902 [Aspergillus saccharolyticus JOP 1030-1]|uniref:Uncharacterized protein n=1 Tax=Aspergillus saccharolyticus JOP 1030-1 TaxID=1450539 RepID=A0A318Z769_9EURO|nr:hypothetical protein BP01DRAFT_384902 [Aspergillus saccharolyticus JOP 1030-1]PYH42949.1 hypothetical protein BP01DRAFT_384902 [Aspergillus saccharolyticus JOP 1030-1]